MKVTQVICIENKDTDGNLHPLLTLNKVYDAELLDGVYIINDDHMLPISLIMDKASYKHFFITLKKHRENKLNQIGI